MLILHYESKIDCGKRLLFFIGSRIFSYYYCLLSNQVLYWRSVGVSSILPCDNFFSFSERVWLKRDSTCPKPNQMTFYNLHHWSKSVPSLESTFFFDLRSEDVNSVDSDRYSLEEARFDVKRQWVISRCSIVKYPNKFKRAYWSLKLRKKINFYIKN